MHEMREKIPRLYIVVPCYNEEEVLPLTVPKFLAKLQHLAQHGLASSDSRLLLVDDGSRDRTWHLISSYAANDPRVAGLRLSRNRGHQNALLAGLMEAKNLCDVTISIDCDGQDDMDAMDEMLQKYAQGAEVVYGIRNDRTSDTFFKRTTAQGFYKFLKSMGADIKYNHADYRLISGRVLEELANYHEVNLFLRGMVPLVGFPEAEVYYVRHEREAGRTHYPLGKMIALAIDGITSLSVKPLRLITGAGLLTALFSFIGIIVTIVQRFCGVTVSGWASLVCIMCFLGGMQLTALGVIGEYIGKIYLEVKARPRFIISERTYESKGESKGDGSK